MPVSLVAFVIACVVTFVAAAVQGVVGIGFAVVSVPVLRLVSPLLAPVPQLFMTLPLTAAMAWRERHDMDIAGVGWILAGRFPGALLGLALLAVASDKALDVIIGLIVLGAVLALASGFSIARTAVTKFVAGTLSGIASLVASVGGPPIALLYRDEKGSTIRSSLALVFFIGIVITVGIRLAAGKVLVDEVVLAAYLLPAQFLGYRVSSWAKDHTSPAVVRNGILVLSFVAASVLLIGTLV